MESIEERRRACLHRAGRAYEYSVCTWTRSRTRVPSSDAGAFFEYILWYAERTGGFVAENFLTLSRHEKRRGRPLGSYKYWDNAEDFIDSMCATISAMDLHRRARGDRRRIRQIDVAQYFLNNRNSISLDMSAVDTEVQVQSMARRMSAMCSEAKLSFENLLQLARKKNSSF